MAECTEPIDLTEQLGISAGPCAVVIFGASGDLTKRKLIPALVNLANQNLLPSDFAVVGVASRQWSHEDFRKKILEDLEHFATTEVSAALEA